LSCVRIKMGTEARVVEALSRSRTRPQGGLGKVVALTGPPRSGKTTVMVRLVNGLRTKGVMVGGMITSELTEGGSRTGFRVTDVSTGRSGTLAKVGPGDGPRIGKYVVDRAGLEDVGVVAIRNAVERSEVIAIDELGPMELTSQAFVEAVEAALSSGKPVVLTLHWRATHPLLDRVRGECRGEIMTVSPSNRTELAEDLESQIMQALSKG